ncbi:MAG: redox-sensing transcriptional repressor Rex [Actinomycetota bacterium]|nr:redox-sensing transcriptional repressor Rex [Actinomycetota bacterium]
MTSDTESGAPVSGATVGRLPAYLRAVVDLVSLGLPSVSSDRLAEETGVNPATVRRDLASLGIAGTRGLGYDLRYLIHEIGLLLGVSEDWPVVIVGAGNLGRALANYQGLAARGFPVRALLDVDPTLVGARFGQVEVLHLDEMERVVGEAGVGVGILATPADQAQLVADRLVALGVSSLLNFTEETLVVPSWVEVRRVDLATELQILSFYQRRTTGARSGAGLPLGHESNP